MWNRESVAKISATIFKTDTGLVVFDLYYKLIRYFTFGGNAVRQVPILFSWKRDTQMRIVYDEVWGKFYLHRYHNQSGQSIQAIDIDAGIAGEPILLEKPLATQIKIKDNAIFYIYRNPNVLSMPQLYKQKIN